MKLFGELTRSQAFLKMGVYGGEGSGKSFTASLIAIGLWKHAGLAKPVAYFDTETGADYVAPLFSAAEIPFVAVKTRALKKLRQAIDEATAEASILIIDSLTHPYRELVDTYVKTKRDGTRFVRLQDWQPIKNTWNEQFATPFVNSPLHIIWCARLKNVFEDVEDDQASQQSGRKTFKSIQVGTAARSETESAYEPSILAEMTKVRTDSDSGAFERTMTIHKERFNVIDGKTFRFQRGTNAGLLESNDPFAAILPHVELLNLGGAHAGYDNATSEELFKPDDGDAEARQVWQRRAVLLERLEGALSIAFPSTGAADRKAKIQVLDGAFGSVSWKEIGALAIGALEAGVEAVDELRRDIEGGGDVADPKAKVAAIRERILKEQFQGDATAEVT